MPAMKRGSPRRSASSGIDRWKLLVPVAGGDGLVDGAAIVGQRRVDERTGAFRRPSFRYTCARSVRGVCGAARKPRPSADRFSSASTRWHLAQSRRSPLGRGSFYRVDTRIGAQRADADRRAKVAAVNVDAGQQHPEPVGADVPRRRETAGGGEQEPLGSPFVEVDHRRRQACISRVQHDAASVVSR